MAAHVTPSDAALKPDCSTEMQKQQKATCDEFDQVAEQPLALLL